MEDTRTEGRVDVCIVLLDNKLLLFVEECIGIDPVEGPICWEEVRIEDEVFELVETRAGDKLDDNLWNVASDDVFVEIIANVDDVVDGAFELT